MTEKRHTPSAWCSAVCSLKIGETAHTECSVLSGVFVEDHNFQDGTCRRNVRVRHMHAEFKEAHCCKPVVKISPV